jgi:uncharacterized protein YdiU (UPF0061 family)
MENRIPLPGMSQSGAPDGFVFKALGLHSRSGIRPNHTALTKGAVTMALSDAQSAASAADPQARTDETPDIFGFETSYARLPERFYARVQPAQVRDPKFLRVNAPLARALGLDPAQLETEDALQVFAGNRVPASADPIAQAYAGHQFGNWVPQLGDGRAVLLGELTDRDGVKRDLQLKGAGKTPFSRMGDGRAALFPVVAEYLGSEAMAALGVPTTRALAMVTTGERVIREDIRPGGVIARVATSHVRVGTFEYFARNGDQEGVKQLADYVLDRHYPELKAAENPYAALLREVTRRTGELVAQWMLVGFIHGVMNTDNVSIVGETIDYGPFAWMDSYHPAACFSAVDMGGRYAFNQQPQMAHWNLCRFAETLLPLLAEDGDKGGEQAKQAAYDALEAFEPAFDARFNPGLRAKLGLASEEEGDVDLALDLLRRMAEEGADFTLTFRRLSDADGAHAGHDEQLRALFRDPESFDEWAKQWRQRLARETRADSDRKTAMRAVNPAFVLRKHHVYRAYDGIVEGDHSTLDALLTVLADPYSDHPGYTAFAQPPAQNEIVRNTFCGT